jgi:hypothetical protein
MFLTSSGSRYNSGFDRSFLAHHAPLGSQIAAAIASVRGGTSAPMEHLQEQWARCDAASIACSISWPPLRPTAVMPPRSPHTGSRWTWRGGWRGSRRAAGAQTSMPQTGELASSRRCRPGWALLPEQQAPGLAPAQPSCPPSSCPSTASGTSEAWTSASPQDPAAAAAAAGEARHGAACSLASHAASSPRLPPSR